MGESRTWAEAREIKLNYTLFVFSLLDGIPKVNAVIISLIHYVSYCSTRVAYVSFLCIGSCVTVWIRGRQFGNRSGK